MRYEEEIAPLPGPRPGAYGLAAAMTAALVLVGGCAGSDGSPDPTTSPTAGGAADASPTGAPRPEPTLPDPTHHELSLEWDGGERDYRVDEPDGYDPDEPTPLVVVLHGGGSSAFSIRLKSRMAQFAQEHGVLVAYPEGVDGEWTTSPDRDDTDDVGFVTALVDHLSGEWNVATGQVYATGWSQGARLSYRLATEAPEVFAAVGPVSGSPHPGYGDVEPAAPVPVVGVVGVDDTGVVDSVATWREMRDCEPGEPAVVPGAEHVTRIDATCSNGSAVVEYRVESAGHVWPHPDTYDFSANDAIWEFFTSHAR